MIFKKIAHPLPIVKLNKLVPDSLKTSIEEAAGNQLSTIKGTVDMMAKDYKEKYTSLELHEIEWHRKFTLSVACLVLFLIGFSGLSVIRY